MRSPSRRLNATHSPVCGVNTGRRQSGRKPQCMSSFSNRSYDGLGRRISRDQRLVYNIVDLAIIRAPINYSSTPHVRHKWTKLTLQLSGSMAIKPVMIHTQTHTTEALHWLSANCIEHKRNNISIRTYYSVLPIVPQQLSRSRFGMIIFLIHNSNVHLLRSNDIQLVTTTSFFPANSVNIIIGWVYVAKAISVEGE